MAGLFQSTLAGDITLSGRGVHSGTPVTVALRPAPVNHGVKFLRTGLLGGRERLVAARYDQVAASELCTIIGDVESGSVSTIEHMMAAFYALGIDNVLVVIDGAEVPILDGSSDPFVTAIRDAGIAVQETPRRYVRILKPVRVEHDGKFSELLPFSGGFRMTVEIAFDTPVIGRQKKTLDITGPVFASQLSRARTFGFLRDVDRLRSAGYALGASLDNTVAIDGDSIMNPEGLRYRDEFVRHKMLDAVGDLSLAGFPIIGHFRSYCGGHRMNVAVLQELFSDRTAFEIVELAGRRPERAGIRAGGPALALAPEVG